MPTADPDVVRRTVEAVWRIEAGRVVAILARQTGDLGLAEDMAQEALASALSTWPDAGVPPNPTAWLITTAKRKAIDANRRAATLRAKAATLVAEANEPVAGIDSDEALDEWTDPIGDDLLRLLFAACHPVLSLDSRVALTLRCLAGLSTEEIARGFLVPEATAAQRIVRAKKTLRDRGIAFELPSPEELSERLASVLEVVYLVFNEGYAATSGADWTRPALCHEAMRLGRVLAALAPAEPEVHGLLALMELQASRLPARTAADGSAVLLPDQDRRRWDRLLVRRGLASLGHAERLAGPVGPYTIQAGIAACHARALRPEDTDWRRIADLYQVLASLWPTPIVELNRAVAVAQVDGPETGLALVEAVAADGSLERYPHLHAVRADLLARLDRHGEAARAFTQAAELTANASESGVFRARASVEAGLVTSV